MNDVISLDENYSTTRCMIKADSQDVADLLKQVNKPKDKFETVLFLPKSEGRQEEGGLRTKGYFKVGGIIPDNEASPLTAHSSLVTKPLITVVTVVFNGEKFLEETILSVINQTYDNVEYIIIDGGSTDGTLEIIKKYEHAIDYWVSENDNGIYDAMNKALRLLLGRYVNFMNAGDLILKGNCLEKICQDFNGADVFLGETIYSNGRHFISNDKLMFLKNRMQHQSIIIRLDVFKSLGLYNLKYEILSDYDFNVRFCFSNYTAKRIEFIAFCDSSGVSSSANWRSYYEEMSIRNMSYKAGIFLAGYSLVRYVIKKSVKFLI